MNSSHEKSTVSASQLKGMLLILLGVFALAWYFSWWFKDESTKSVWVFAGFVFALAYGFMQILCSWVIYLATYNRPRRQSQVTKHLTIDVFVTCCREDFSLVQRALAAACSMHGDHRTWLLDDGNDPAMARLAQTLGAGYLTRIDRKDAKAGNINAALTRTTGDIVVIFDVDHAPVANFLEATVGHFAEQKFGFVQVMLTFANGADGWIAQAAAESSYDFYSSISIGAGALGSATLIGTNALIRRSALEAIGGYQPGLAEDLETSIALHAAGWQSLYIALPLAPGFAPPDLGAWFTQQFKWSRGVFETLLVKYPRYFRNLTLQQRLVYAVRMTYYWFGTVVCIHVLLALGALFVRNTQHLTAFEDYLHHLLPIATMVLLIRTMALRRWRFRNWNSVVLHRNLQWKPIVLVFATWPIYTVAWLMALLRLPLQFRPTPKTRLGSTHPLWLSIQVLSTLLLSVGLAYFVWTQQVQNYLLTVSFSAGLVVAHLLFLWQYWWQYGTIQPDHVES